MNNRFLIIRHTFRFILIATMTLSIFAFTSLAWTAPNPFPVYKSIKPNVDFWKKVYSKYASTQGILHDSRNLKRIYGVIKLKHADQHGARRVNRARIKKAKNKYKAILINLSKGKTGSTSKEKQIAALFGPKTTRAAYRKAAQNIRCQVGQKDRFRKGVIRSGAYLKEIKGIFRKSGLPTDLAYLPHVESSFNPKAYSKFGASGIWQFTRGTGRRFMTINYTVDERRDPILSSRSAVKLLKENYQKLGNWPLALTAYNHGANGMLRAKRSHGGYEAIFNKYNGRRFKFASRNFYAEFIAALKVAKNYQKSFGKLRLDRPEETRSMTMAGFVAVKDLSHALKVDVSEIRRLNPALREPIYREEKYIPKGFHVRLSPKKGGYMAKLPRHIVKSKQKRSQFYKVERGDTAGKIARMHGVSLRELARANNLNSRATIYVGQYLRLPALGESTAMLASAEPARISEKVKSKSKAKPKVPSQPVITPAVTTEKITVVEATEPKEDAQIAKAPVQVDPSVVTGDLGIKKVVTRKGKHVGVIHVAVEETLGHYADWLDVPAHEIRRVNGLRYGKVLKINQSIKVPLHKVSKDSFEEKRLEYHKEIVEDFFSTYRVDQIQVYQIKRGDNIWTLCREVFEVPVWLVQKYNNDINFSNLKTAQSVKIPVVEKNSSI